MTFQFWFQLKVNNVLLNRLESRTKTMEVKAEMSVLDKLSQLIGYDLKKDAG